MTYLDITKETIVYALRKSDKGKKEIREGRFVVLKYYSVTDKYEGVINLAGIGEINIKGSGICLYPTEREAINEQNPILPTATTYDIMGLLHESKIDKIKMVGDEKKLAVEFWEWDGVKPNKIYCDFIFDVLNRRMIYDTPEGGSTSYEECAELNTPTIYRF